MGNDGDPRPGRFPATIVVAVVAGLLLAAVVVGAEMLAAAADPQPGRGLPVFGDGPLPAAEQIVSNLDGERYAQVAADPTLANPRRDFNGNVAQAAYVGSRPLLSWLAWAGSAGGRSGAVAWALVVLSVLSAGVLVLAVAMISQGDGRNPLWAWTAIALPGTIAVLQSPGEGDLLATALVLLGAMLWLDDDRPTLAVATLILAALARETTLVVPGALFAYGALRDRRPRWSLLLPFAAYAGWVIAVRARVGVWPSAGGGDNLNVPFAQLRDALALWHLPEVASAALLVALVLASWRNLAGPVRLIVVLYLGLVPFMAVQVMAFWWAFGRVLLPAYALCLAAVLPRVKPLDSRPEPTSRVREPP